MVAVRNRAGIGPFGPSWKRLLNGAAMDEFRIVRPKGRLDGTTGILFEQDVQQEIDAGHTELVVDMSQLEYISSAGLRALLVVAKKLKAAGGRMALCALRKPVKEIFDVTGYTTLLDVFPTKDAATAHLSMR